MIDSHAHVAFSQFDDDREAVIERARQAGVAGWIEVGTDLEQSGKAIELARQSGALGATVGVHPSDVAGLTESDWQELEVLLNDERVVAVGEVGFDYYRGGTLAEQLPALERFAVLASRRDLPVVWHVRNSEQVSAHEDMIDFLRTRPDRQRLKGVMHTFSGTEQQAKEYLDLGMYLSFSGVVTFKNAAETAEIVRDVSLDRLLIETDCPFLAPEPHRGQRNEPAYVGLVAEKIAEMRGMSVSEVQQATDENTRRLFRM